jgi:hypothetical protein
MSTPWNCAAHSRTAPTPHPSKEDGGTLERGTTIYSAPAQDGAMTSDQWSASPPSPPALRGQPRHYATISGTAAPSLTLWKPKATRHRHARCCASSGLPSAEPSSQRMDDDQTRGPYAATLEAAPERVQDSPRRLPGARFTRITINSATLCAIPPYVAFRTVWHRHMWRLELCGTIVIRLTLVYKRRRRSPGREEGQIAAHLHVSAHIHGIGTPPQSNLRDLEASPLLPPCL